MIPKESIRTEIARAALVREEPAPEFEPDIPRRNWWIYIIAGLAAAAYFYFMVTL